MKKTLAGLFFITCSLFGSELDLTIKDYNKFIENEKIPWKKQCHICEREGLFIKNDAKECLKAANMVLDLKGKKLSDIENAMIRFGVGEGSIEKTVGFYFVLAGNIYNANGDYKNELEMYEKAIKYKSPEAFYNLGATYYNGKTVSKNHIKAYEYFKEALRLGRPDAQNAIETVCKESPWACK